MKLAPKILRFAGAVLATVLILALTSVFRAYLSPNNVVQWLLVLQLCR